MKNQVNMTPPKESNKISITAPKAMEIYEQLKKELKQSLLNK